MSFTLSGGKPTVEVSASAWISGETDTTVTITVQSNAWMVYSGSWVQSSGVVAGVLIGDSGWMARKTIFGNGTYAEGTSVRSVQHSHTINKTTSSQSIYWASHFLSYTDGVQVGDVKAIKEGNISVKAKTSYTVTYNANGGSGAPSAQTKWHGTNLTLSSTKPTRTGYSFQGWGTSASDTSVDYAAGATYSSNKAITLYAIWKANTYTVTYNANGGSGAPSAQTKTYGVDLTLSTTKPTRTNYNFLGWSTSSIASSAQYTSGGKYTANAAVTLYAVWELAYWKPKITNLTIERCAQNGGVDEYGTYAKVEFDYELCQLIGTNTTATILISRTSGSNTFTKTGATGMVSQIVGGGELSIESSYVYTVTVTDNTDSSSLDVSLPGAAFPLDIKSGGTGIAFGKPATDSEVVDSAWPFRTNDRFVAYVDSTPQLREKTAISTGVNLNNLITPGTYCCNDTVAASLTNSPTTYGFSMDVSYSYGDSNFITQRIYVPYHEIEYNRRHNVSTGSWSAWKKFLSIDAIFPVGSIVIRYDHTSPATLYGGTWVRIENRYLWGIPASSTIGQTGGAATHTLTIAEMPSHQHGSGTYGYIAGTQYGWHTNTSGSNTTYNNWNTAYTGGGGAHNNHPPYIQVSIWRRTA